MGRTLFVYWQAAAGAAAPAEAAARAIQRDLRQRHPGLRAQLYRRAEPQDGRVTLMETYALTSHGGIDATLQAAVDIASAAGAALRVWCEGTRHVEVFDALGDDG